MTPQPPPQPPDLGSEALAALVAEAGRKSGLLWASWDGSTRPRPLWHVWHDGAACVVIDGGEQPAPGLAAAQQAEVVLRSKDTGARLVTWTAGVEVLAARTPEWESAVEALRPERLNAGAEDLAVRWAESSTVLRLVPTGDVRERPGAYDAGSHAAPPAPTPATTRGKRPPVLHRRQRRAPRL